MDFQPWSLALLILLRRWIQEFRVNLSYMGSSGLTWATLTLSFKKPKTKARTSAVGEMLAYCVQSHEFIPQL